MKTLLCKVSLFLLILLISLYSYASNNYAANNKVYASSIIRDSNKSILNIDLLPQQFTELIIDVKCELEEKHLILPEGASLNFTNNGYIDNGIITGCNSTLSVDSHSAVIGVGIKLTGKWINNAVYDFWFDFDTSSNFISNQIITNILSLSDDNHLCHIYFQAPRTYLFELPYKGAANIGDMLPFTMVNGKKKREYENLYEDDYSFLRIFSIPSNTHLTIDNRLKMLPTNQGAYFVFWQYKKNNIVIDGKGSIIGDVFDHIYDSPFIKGSNYYGEWGFIFCCIACSDFRFNNILIEGAFGDCLMYTSDYFTPNISNRNSTNLIVSDVKIKYARRNGITIAAENVLIQNTLFQGCGIDSIKGTAPCAGIDFEPDGIRKCPNTGNSNVEMIDCVFVNNRFDVSSTFNNLESFGKIATYIADCNFTAPLRLNTTNWIEFNNCIIPGITNYQNKIALNCPVKHITFKNCTIMNLPPILLTKSWNNTFIDCTFKK